MIALNETDPVASEVPFFLASSANPLVGVTLHDFSNNTTTGEVKMRLPTGTFGNVVGSQIVEKGNGWYAVQLTSGQTTIAGVVSLQYTVTGTQPGFITENIGTAPGGDFAVLGVGYIPFDLPNPTDPVYGAPVTGWTFTLGQVQKRIPGGGGFVNVALTDIIELGLGGYAIRISSADTANRGKIYLKVDIGASSQPFSSYNTVLGVSGGTGGGVIGGPGTAVPVASPYAPSSPAYMDHTAGAINRLCEYAKAKAA